MNATVELNIFLNRTHPAMIQINTIAYILELFYYTSAVIFLPAYVVLSRFARRFHPLLRLQLRLLLVEVIVIIITRGVGIVFRLIEGASIVLSPPVLLVRVSFTHLNYAMVNQVDLSVFLIALERLLATYRIRTYEREFHHPLYRFLILLYVLIIPNIVFLYFLLVLVNNMDYVSIWNYVTTVTYLIGMLAMETSRILSKRQLESEDRELSTSFQCKENIMVVRMFRPVFILFFLTRIVEFCAKYYMANFEASLGAVPLRIVTHLYNQSVGICFCLLPLMLLKNHNNLTRFTRQSAVVHQVNHQDLYFQCLMEKWQID